MLLVYKWFLESCSYYHLVIQTLSKRVSVGAYKREDQLLNYHVL